MSSRHFNLHCFMQKKHTVDNWHVIIWTYLSKVEAHKRQRSILKH